MSEPVTKPSLLPCWVYPLPNGCDLEVYAPDEKSALEAMALGGYTNLDPKKLKKTGKTLDEAIDEAHQSVESERRQLGLASTWPAPKE